MDATVTTISLTNAQLWELLRTSWLEGLESGRSGGEVSRKELWASFRIWSEPKHKTMTRVFSSNSTSRGLVDAKIQTASGDSTRNSPTRILTLHR